MKIHSRSVWSREKIAAFLTQARIPMRLACQGKDGFPVVCSLWFFYDDGVLWSASHKNAHIVNLLAADSKVGIEIATNDYPYHGVRGKGTAQLLAEGAGSALDTLIQKYLGDGNQALASWLMGRVNDEYAIRITPAILNSWDFSDRMEKQR